MTKSEPWPQWAATDSGVIRGQGRGGSDLRLAAPYIKNINRVISRGIEVVINTNWWLLVSVQHSLPSGWHWEEHSVPASTIHQAVLSCRYTHTHLAHTAVKHTAEQQKDISTVWGYSIQRVCVSVVSQLWAVVCKSTQRTDCTFTCWLYIHIKLWQSRIHMELPEYSLEPGAPHGCRIKPRTNCEWVILH